MMLFFNCTSKQLGPRQSNSYPAGTSHQDMLYSIQSLSAPFGQAPLLRKVAAASVSAFANLSLLDDQGGSQPLISHAAGKTSFSVQPLCMMTLGGRKKWWEQKALCDLQQKQAAERKLAKQMQPVVKEASPKPKRFTRKMTEQLGELAAERLLSQPEPKLRPTKKALQRLCI